MLAKLARMTKPAKLKLTIYQGATFRKRLTWLDPSKAPIDLTGCTARMQVRAEIESADALLELTTENGGIAIDGPAGLLTLHIAPVATAAIAWQSGVWDLEVAHPNGDVTRLVQGSINVMPEVTRG